MGITSPLMPDEKAFARMEADLFRRLGESRAKKMRRHRFVAVGAVLLIAAGGGSIAATTVANQASIAHRSYCYGTSDGSGPTSEVFDASVANAKPPTRPRTQKYAIDLCTLSWESGSFAVDRVVPPGTSIKVPHLQVCIRNDLSTAVLPNPRHVPVAEFCDNAGMSAPVSLPKG